MFRPARPAPLPPLELVQQEDRGAMVAGVSPERVFPDLAHPGDEISPGVVANHPSPVWDERSVGVLDPLADRARIAPARPDKPVRM